MKKVYYPNELIHWGIKGQKWGIRRYQNKDGTLTEEGKRKYKYNDNPTTVLQTMRKNIIDSRLNGTKYKGIHKLGVSRSIEDQAKSNENWSKYYTNKAKKTKNRFMKELYSNSAYNDQQLANYYKLASKYSLKDKWVKAGSLIDKNYRNVKTKDLFTGVNITMGERYLLGAIQQDYNQRYGK